MKRRTIIAVAILLLGLAVMFVAGFRLFEANKMYREADVVYEHLRSKIRRAPEVSFQMSQAEENVIHSIEAGENEDAHIFIPDFEIDHELLKSINKDAAAWLYSPDTVIDYPVMRADDYRYYLNHLADGTVNANGSLFIDYNNSPDFSDPLTVIYGHHMKSGSMFGGLKGYKNQGYYDNHPYMYLYTEQGNYRIDLMYGFVLTANQWMEHGFMYSDNVEALLEYAMKNTTFQSHAKFRQGSRVLALSTCSYEFDDARYVVIGVFA